MREKIRRIAINDHIWLLNDNDESTAYLVIGKEKALLIDTMNGYENVMELVEELTSLPVIVVNTHGHPDHTNGNRFFNEVYLHAKDWQIVEQYMRECPFADRPASQTAISTRYLSIEEKDTFNLGGISLEVFEVPGHTPGGIVLLDRKDRILFTGDSIIEQTWMQLEESLPMKVFYDALENLAAIRKDYDWILTGHTRQCLENGDLYESHKQAVKEVVQIVEKEESPEQIVDGDYLYEWEGGLAKAHPYGNQPRRIVYGAIKRIGLIESKPTDFGRFVVREDQITVNGEKCPYSYVELKRGACILPFVHGKVVLLNEYRYPIRSWQKELPGGIIEENESPAEAAKRELQEETGLVCKELIDLGSLYPSFGSTNEEIYLFAAECETGGDTNLDVGEVLNMELVSMEQLKKMISSGIFQHGAGLAAVARYIMRMD